jgi:hypothetical protein
VAARSKSAKAKSTADARAALQNIERPPPGRGDYLARFERNRERLEQIASKKHARGQVEK